MKNFKRNDYIFSLCGLNCILCPMKLGNYCPGCGGGDGNQGCAIARCSLKKQNIEYCFQCGNYPCEKYNDIDKYDSFITHHHQLLDMEKIQKIGIEQYHSELFEKFEILNYLLENYNDGRKKNFFCITTNLLDINDLKEVVEELKTKTQAKDMTLKEKSAIATMLFQSVAVKRNIILKLNKKPSRM